MHCRLSLSVGRRLSWFFCLIWEFLSVRLTSSGDCFCFVSSVPIKLPDTVHPRPRSLCFFGIVSLHSGAFISWPVLRRFDWIWRLFLSWFSTSLLLAADWAGLGVRLAKRLYFWIGLSFLLDFDTVSVPASRGRLLLLCHWYWGRIILIAADDCEQLQQWNQSDGE